MKIEGQNPNQPLFGDEPAGSAAAESGRLGRWSGLPGTPGPSRLGPGEESAGGTDAASKLAQRQPLWDDDQGVEETSPQDLESLQAWLAASPDNIKLHAENHVMDALLQDYFRKG